MTHDELTALEADLEQFREWLDGPGPEFPPVEEIDRLAAKIHEIISLAHRELERETRVSTHAPGCHAWGPRHYDCLMREHEAARAALAQAQEAIEPIVAGVEDHPLYGVTIRMSAIYENMVRARSALDAIRKVLG